MAEPMEEIREIANALKELKEQSLIIKDQSLGYRLGKIDARLADGDRRFTENKEDHVRLEKDNEVAHKAILDSLHTITTKLNRLDGDTIRLKTKMGIYGAIGGAIIGLLGLAKNPVIHLLNSIFRAI